MVVPQFTLRIRIGDQEVELGGTREEVMAVLEDLEEIISKVSNAFRSDLRAVEEITTDVPSSKTLYPTISQTPKCSEAVLNLLRTDWGKEPRALSELKEGMEANAIHFPSSTLSGTLNWLVKKGKLRRWKGESGKYQYTLVEGGG
jgi:hypothetical protein